MAEIHTVENLSDFIKLIIELNPLILTTNRDPLKTQEVLYRGHSNKDYKIIPSLGRGCKEINGELHNQLCLKEKEIIEYAKMKLPNEFNINNPIDILAKMQHYGLPTRLLDVTSNPLVALYFACSNNDVDGEVLIFSADEVMSPFDSIPQIIASTYRLFSAPKMTDYDFTKKADEYKICSESFKHYRNEFMQIASKQFLFMNASETILRQKMQQGKYILFTNKVKRMHEPGWNYLIFEDYIEEIKDNCSILKYRIYIPCQFKSKILAQLNIMGISKSTLFSDSIDIVCDEISNTIRYKLS